MVSVIVPAYNLENYIARTLDSILAQTCTDIEIIIVDDGSTDGTLGVLRQYEREHAAIRVIHKENGGVTSARLRGIQEATGEWIGFVDGDDEIEPDMYERLLKNAMEHNAEISHCGYQMVFGDGRINFFHNTGVVEEQDNLTALRELLSGTRIEPGLWNKLFRATLFQNLQMDESIKINEDLLMNFYLFSAADTSVYEDWCPYHYIVRGDSASRSKLNEHKIYDPIRVKEVILTNAPAELKEDAQRALMSTCVYSYSNLIMEKELNVQQAKRHVRNILCQHRDWCACLPSRTKLLAKMIIYLPWAFRIAYPIYARHFQKSKYS